MKAAKTLRLAGLGMATVLGAAAAVWIERTARQQMDRLRIELSDPALATLVDALQRSWFLSLVLVAVVAALATAVFYRRLVVPLRAQLSESRTHLERHEKLASLGVLAAGIAHEIRNPLTAIKVRLFSLKRSIPYASSVQEDVQVISGEIHRLERIVEDSLQFARPPELDCRLVHVGNLLRDVGNLLEPQLARRRVRLVRESALEAWVRAVHQAKPKLPVVLMTAHGTTDTAIEATRWGAFDYVPKPFEMDEMLDITARAIECSRLMSEPVAIGPAESSRTALVGRSRTMQAIYKEIGRVAATKVTVLIRGDTGTGKELVRHFLRKHGPEVGADSPSIQPEALEYLQRQAWRLQRGGRISRFPERRRSRPLCRCDRGLADKNVRAPYREQRPSEKREMRLHPAYACPFRAAVP